MAYIKAEIKIKEVFRTVPVQLYFPTDLPQEVGNRVRGVLTLLHGMSNTASDWVTMSAAARYAADNGYILVMPDAENSFYTNMHGGAPFFDILTAYLPKQLEAIFKIPTQREQNHIAGLSMGGYGALHIGLRFPERYAHIGSFSGCVDMAFLLESAQNAPEVPETAVLQGAFGKQLQLKAENDLFNLAKQVAALPQKEKPKLFCTCGKQDTGALMVEQNRRFQQHVQNLDLPAVFEYWDGVHEWNVWDRSLTAFIACIEGSDYAQRKQQDWSASASDTL